MEKVHCLYLIRNSHEKTTWSKSLMPVQPECNLECDCHDYQKKHSMYCYPETDEEKGICVENVNS